MDFLKLAESDEKDERFGGKTSFIPFAYHLLPPAGLAKTAAIMRGGELAGRGPNDWREIPEAEHLNHALSHIIAYLASKPNGKIGGKPHPHLAQASCRILMALEMSAEPVINPEPTP